MPTTDDAPPGRDAALGDLLFRQDGVIARRQALAVGCSPEFIRCRLRRREWARPVPGVYVTHTGPLSWRQRAWVAILDLYPAALAGRSWHDGPGARDRDLERDLDAVAGAGRTTVRLGPGQVFDRPCLTAAKVAAVLTAHGWTGTLERCPHCPDDGPVPQP